MTTTPELLPPAMRLLLDAAPGVTDTVIAAFAARSLTAAPIVIRAGVRIDTTWSTPELALEIGAEDPSGFVDYDANVRVTGSLDGSTLYVTTTHYDQHRMDSTNPTEVGLFIVGLLVGMVPA